MIPSSSSTNDDVIDHKIIKELSSSNKNVDDDSNTGSSNNSSLSLSISPLCYIYSLPVEVFEMVMRNFQSKEICIYINSLSRFFNRVSKSISLWHYYCVKDFKINTNVQRLFNQQIDWYKEYVLMYRALKDIGLASLYLSDEQSLRIINSHHQQQQYYHYHQQQHPHLNILSNSLNSSNELFKSNNTIILNTRKSKPDSTLFIQSKKKITPLPFGNFTVAYFEITLLAAGVDQNIFIGYSLSTQQYDKKQVLKTNVSYHGGDGGMYYTPVMGKEISEPWMCNDSVGCGYDFLQKVIFFTKNGVLLGKSSLSISITKLYATIGTISYGDKFSINFGAKRFEYDIIQYQQEHQQQQQQQQSMFIYPLYSLQQQLQEKYLVEYFEDGYSDYHDEEMNKIATPINKEIAYLSNLTDFETDRIMKNKIHKYCHQIGQQINGGFALPPEDQNIAELRRGLAWYWVATKQHYLLLYFARASAQSAEIDLKYSPARDFELSPTLDDIEYAEEFSKRRMVKDIGVLLSSQYDISHPFVTSVVRHARQTLRRFNQNMTTQERSIFNDFEQMLQAAEQADHRMFLALSLSIITQTKEIIKNTKSKQEKRFQYFKKEKELKDLEYKELESFGFNHYQLQQQQIEVDNDIITTTTTTTANQSNISSPSPRRITTIFNQVKLDDFKKSWLQHEEDERQQQQQHASTAVPLVEKKTKIEKRLNFLKKQIETLQGEIGLLNQHVGNAPLSEYCIDVIVWTSLRLSNNIKETAYIVSSKNAVLETLQLDRLRLENEMKHQFKLLYPSAPESKFYQFYNPLLSTTKYGNNKGGATNQVDEAAGEQREDEEEEEEEEDENNRVGSVQLNDLAIDIQEDIVRRPLKKSSRLKSKRQLSRPLAIGAIVISAFAIILVIILLSVFLVSKQ